MKEKTDWVNFVTLASKEMITINNQIAGNHSDQQFKIKQLQ